MLQNRIKIHQEKNVYQKKNCIVGKKLVCVLFVWIASLLDPFILGGCASERDTVTMALAAGEAAVQPPDGISLDKNMTDVSFLDATTGTAQAGAGLERTTGAGKADAGLDSTKGTGEANVGTEGTTKGTNLDGDKQPQVYIYVCGAVVLPGVYNLAQGSRLYEAVELAGGLTAEADENCLNMARQIVDGEQVVIWTQEEALALQEAGAYTYPSGNVAQGTADKDTGLVNINTATVVELTTVSGIGEGRAQAIVEYREKHGSFESIDEIKKVDGIKDGLFAKIKDKITI